jgi:vacuolar-type H+-ATPase subunit H
MNLPKFLEELRDIAHHLEMRIYQEIEEFHEEAKQIYTDVMAVAEKALEQADRYLEKFVLSAINYLESRVSEHVHECLEGRREQLLEILANARSALRECLASTENKFEDFKSQVAAQIALILGDADQLKDILQKCHNEENLLEQVKCMFDSVSFKT